MNFNSCPDQTLFQLRHIFLALEAPALVPTAPNCHHRLSEMLFSRGTINLYKSFLRISNAQKDSLMFCDYLVR